MSITIPREDEVLSLALAFFADAHRDPLTGRSPQLGPRSFLGHEARALAQLVGEVLAAVRAADDDGVPGGVYVDAQGVTRTRNSSKALDDWAFDLGLPSNVADFGRNGAQPARGGGATAAGTPGLMVAAGAGLTDNSGQVELVLRTGFTMPALGSVGVALDAVTPGAAGNLAAGTPLRWTSPPPGLASTLTLAAPLRDGYDAESDVALALRIVRFMQAAVEGGTASDYRRWAESAEDGSGALVGVARAFVYPLRDGTGSVTVVPVLGGSGSARDPGATKRAQIQAWVDARRIASDTAYVVRPYFNTATEQLVVAVRVVEAPAFPFDWVADPALPIKVVSGAASTDQLVVDQSPLPGALALAVAAGKKPRVAFCIPTYGAVPLVAAVTGVAADTPTAGQSTLTLDAKLPVNALALADVLPASDATIPVALAVLAYTDSVGPSRASGFADPADYWADRLTVGGVAEAALSARDPATGARCLAWSPLVGNPAGTTEPGVTVKVGAAAESTDDYQLHDNVPDRGPQLPNVAQILVRKAAR